MKKILFTTILIFSFLLNAKNVLIDQIAIIVNGEAVTLYDLKKQLNPANPAIVSIEALKKQKQTLLQKIIEKKLIEQEIKKRKIEVSKQEVERALKNVAMNNKMSVEQFKKVIKKQGIDFLVYKNTILIAQLKKMKLQQKIAFSELDPSETDLQKLYNELYKNSNIYTASHIILTSSSQQDTEIYAKILEIYNNIVSGKISFEDAAKQFSQDASAKNGGKLGSFTLNRMVPEFSKQLKNLKKGEISKPFKTRFGWHIVRLDNIEKKAPEPFDNVREKLKNIYFMKNQDKAFKNWLKAKQKASHISIFF